MAVGRGERPTVEEVEAQQQSEGSACSPVVCILSISLCLVLAALVVVTALHTHTKLQASDDSDPQAGCQVGRSGLRVPCHLQRSNFTAEVGAGAACAGLFEFACPTAGMSRKLLVSHSQLLLLAVARTACAEGSGAVETAIRAFFNVSDAWVDVAKPVFNC